MIKIYTDGGSRGNPGHSAIGVAIYNGSGTVIHTISRYIGIATNNVAEYSAIVSAWTWISTHKNTPKESIEFYMDSELIYSQLTGRYRIKDPKLKELWTKIKNLEAEYNHDVIYAHVRREKNKMADLLVNKALDEKLA